MSKQTPEQRREYYEKHRSEILEKNRLWRVNNKEKNRERKRLYESQPHRKIIKRAKSKREYIENKEKIILRMLLRRQERKKFIDSISLKYGCQNPDCKWKEKFDPIQLTFHHLDPSLKEIEVAKMHSWSYKNIVKEINKCVSLCRNCHPFADRGELNISEVNLCKTEIPFKD